MTLTLDKIQQNVEKNSNIIHFLLFLVFLFFVGFLICFVFIMLLWKLFHLSWLGIILCIGCVLCGAIFILFLFWDNQVKSTYGKFKFIFSSTNLNSFKLEEINNEIIVTFISMDCPTITILNSKLISINGINIIFGLTQIKEILIHNTQSDTLWEFKSKRREELDYARGMGYRLIWIINLFLLLIQLHWILNL